MLPTYYAVVATDGRVLEASDGLLDRFGSERSASTLAAIVGGPSWELLEVAVADAAAGKRAELVADLELDGERSPFQVSLEPTTRNGEPVACLIAVDLSTHRELENLVEVQRSRTQTLLDSARESIHVIDLKTGKYLDMNASGYRMLGIEPGELDSVSMLDISAPIQDDGLGPEQSFARRLNELIESGEPHQSGNWHVFDGKTGEPRVHEFIATLVNDGTALRVMEYDVTDSVKAEAALRQSEADLRATLRSIADAMIATDSDLRIIRMNPVAEHLTGVSASEAIGRALHQVVELRSATTGNPVALPDKASMLAQRSLGSSEDLTLVSATDREHRIASSVAPVVHDGGHIDGVVIMLRDTTELHLANRRLIEVQKMQAIGLLAGGIAHEFNNLLAVISGATEMLGIAARADLTAQSTSLLDAVIRATDRGQSLTTQLLAVGQREAIERSEYSVHQAIQNAMGRVASTFDDKTTISTELLSANDQTVGHRSLFEQALTNLATNAHEARDPTQGVRISIATETVRNDVANSDQDSAGELIRIRFCDDGPGIAETDIDRVFEPFFTSRKDRGAAGLGLAIVYGAVDNHRGTIVVSSALGQGTEFEITLPLVPQSEPESSTGVDMSPANELAVLVVDDEPDVLTIAQLALESVGYRVLTASGGADALELLRTAEANIEVVILDMNMPGMSGSDVIDGIRSIGCKCSIIVSSGYADAADRLSQHRGEIAAYLSKPYRLASLTQTVAEVVG